MRTYLPEMAQHFVMTLLMSIEFDHIHWHDEDILLLDTLAVSSFWENNGKQAALNSSSAAASFVHHCSEKFGNFEKYM